MKKRFKKIVSSILIGCMAVAMFSISAFAGQAKLLTTYKGYGVNGYVRVYGSSATALLEYEKSDKLKILLNTYWSDDGTHYYYTSDSANTTGKSVDVYWKRAAGQTAKSSTAYFYINNNNFATKTATV